MTTLIEIKMVEGKINTITKRNLNNITILYAPTWEGMLQESNYSSVKIMAETIIQKIQQNKNIRIIFKPHPFSGMRDHEIFHILSRIKSLLQLNPNNIYSYWY